MYMYIYISKVFLRVATNLKHLDRGPVLRGFGIWELNPKPPVGVGAVGGLQAEP